MLLKPSGISMTSAGAGWGAGAGAAPKGSCIFLGDSGGVRGGGGGWGRGGGGPGGGFCFLGGQRGRGRGGGAVGVWGRFRALTVGCGVDLLGLVAGGEGAPRKRGSPVPPGSPPRSREPRSDGP